MNTNQHDSMGTHATGLKNTQELSAQPDPVATNCQLQSNGATSKPLYFVFSLLHIPEQLFSGL